MQFVLGLLGVGRTGISVTTEAELVILTTPCVYKLRRRFHDVMPHHRLDSKNQLSHGSDVEGSSRAQDR